MRLSERIRHLEEALETCERFTRTKAKKVSPRPRWHEAKAKREARKRQEAHARKRTHYANRKVIIADALDRLLELQARAG